VIHAAKLKATSSGIKEFLAKGAFHFLSMMEIGESSFKRHALAETRGFFLHPSNVLIVRLGMGIAYKGQPEPATDRCGHPSIFLFLNDHR